MLPCVGMSHVVAIGIRKTGGSDQLVFYCWGRADLGQLVVDRVQDTSDMHIATPRPIRHPGILKLVYITCEYQ